ncbi:MAG: hypothetical protein WAK28_29700 [Trebonia sp.]
MSLPPGIMVPGGSGCARAAEQMRRRGLDMGDWSGAATQRVLMAEALGLAMARRAAGILDRHRDVLARAAPGAMLDPAEFAADDAIFTAVLDAANECLGRFDARPAGDRWCDALLQLLQLAQSAREAG